MPTVKISWQRKKKTMRRRRRWRRRTELKKDGVALLLKSRDPHLAGGEKWQFSWYRNNGKLRF